MSSLVINSGHDKGSNKRNKKYQSPFRIKVGYLVALRYRSKGNQVSVLMPDGDPAASTELDKVEEENCHSYKEEVSNAHFSEVWTDPQRGRDDGLALIGSRIRCFFPKAILLKPYNAVGRLLEGTIVNVVRKCDDQHTPRYHISSERSSFMVDLLIDNKDDKMLSVTLPFLKRLDNDGQIDPAGKILKESEQRRRRYEERIKGGKHKAIVRISLSKSSLSRSVRRGGDPFEAKWVIRKRVPTKIVRRELPVPIVSRIPYSLVDNKTKGKVQQMQVTSDNNSCKPGCDPNTAHLIGNGEKNCDDGNEKYESNGEQKAWQTFPESINKKRRENEHDLVTSFNKNFSLPRFLGDGNDSTPQQEVNWRWEAGRYHNPYHAALADRPISKNLLKKLSYNFVGEVVNIQPMEKQQPKSSSIETLAMVTMRLLVLPEHTHSGRLAHHGPLDTFESDDLDVNTLFREGGQKWESFQNRSNITEKQHNLVDPIVNHGSARVQRCFLNVPIEELVIVERNICHNRFGSNESQNTNFGKKEMVVQHSYSFLSDTYNHCKQENEVSENPDDRIKHEKSARHKCRRCRHISTAIKRLAGVSHSLCERCFDYLKRSDAARWGIYQNSKSKKYRCDCDFCVDKKNTDLLVDLADEVLESESKLGSTLYELEDYSAHRDSGFIATRFVMKGMNPVDFTISPSSLSSYVNSASSKPITKIKTRVYKGTKKLNARKNARTSTDMDSKKMKGKKSPARKGEKGCFLARDHGVISTKLSKKEPFRSTSSRLLPYDVSNRKFDVSAAELYQWKMFRSSISAFPEKSRNLRQNKKIENGEDFVGNNSVVKKLQGRAARAKQRRLLRGVSALGVDVDTLAGRETNVRFDRSNIHGWGVFTDIDIRQGEMIIEYRGELIGNAVAEKREKEYEAAKIGSDYMFRTDEYTVCDASKHGNVARFMNASCTPNCFPKIIFLDGMKRVVVYAKRHIQAGEELCYDYKFDLEYDPAKRIPCICGAAECCGFLNWDQRYVALPNNDNTGTSRGEK